MVTTVGDEDQANELARELVMRRQAACVNMLSSMKSVYRWKGKICRDSEYLLIIKTEASEFEQVADTIREIHQYDLPEILALEITKGDPDFLAWIHASLDKNADDFEDEEDGLPDLDSM